MSGHPAMTAGSFATFIYTDLGDERFMELLVLLPDAFFRMDFQAQETYWREIFVEFNQGERDPARLASLVEG